MSGQGGKKVLLPPINFIFKLLQTQATVQIWLFEQLQIRVEGKLRVCHACSNCLYMLLIRNRASMSS